MKVDKDYFYEPMSCTKYLKNSNAIFKNRYLVSITDPPQYKKNCKFLVLSGKGLYDKVLNIQKYLVERSQNAK